MEPISYEELLRRDSKVITHVVGNSMLPLLRNRESIVVVEDACRVPPRRGDVVLYKTGDTYILHRVLRVRPEGYLIRGDNTWTLERVPKAALLATMTGFYRHAAGRLVSREDAAYRLYRLALPGIRWTLRVCRHAKRVTRRICPFFAARKPDGK